MKRCPLRVLKFAVAMMICLAASAGLRADGNLRYLFLIDQSPEMATRQIASVQIVYNVIRTGFQNEIQPGEKFALWFCGSRLQTNSPFTWEPGHAGEFASAAANLFGGRIYSRLRPREQTLADAAPFIAASPKITIFIVTDGGQPLAGTPFDDAINAAIDAKHFAFMTADKPFVITLMAKNGSLVAGNVYTNLAVPFQIPEMEHRNELIDQALAAVRTAPGGTSGKAAADSEFDKARAALRDALSGKTPPPAPAKPAVVAKMDFAPTLKEPPKEDPKATEETKPKEEAQPKEPKTEAPVIAPQVVAAEKPAPPPQKAETPPPTLVAQKASEAVATPPPAQIEKSPEPKLVVRDDPKPTLPEQPKPVLHEESKPQPPPQPAPAIIKPVPPAPSFAEQPKPTQPKRVETTPQKPAPAQVQASVVTPVSKGFPWSIVVIGLGLIFTGACIALYRARQRAKSPGSIITQALPRPGPPLRPK